MSQAQILLTEICENVRGTDFGLDVQDIIKAGAGKHIIGLTYKADGADRASHIATQLKKDLESKVHGLLRTDRILMQMITSSAKPALMKELTAISRLVSASCKSPRQWLNLFKYQDESLGGSLKVLIILWVEPQGSLN